MLKKAGLVKVNAGLGGAHLLKSIENITLFDVYKAVDVVEDGHLFQIHKDTDQECIMGWNIENVLDIILIRAEKGMGDVLRNVTMDYIVINILKEIE